jgi:S-layer homology domain
MAKSGMSNHGITHAIVLAGILIAAAAMAQMPPNVVAARAAAESFGPGVQGLYVGAAEFQHLNNKSGYEIDWFSDGYLGYTDESFIGVFVAPLTLPVGSEITMLCTHFLDTEPVGKVSTYLDAVKMNSAGDPPAVVPVLGPVEFDTDQGYEVTCGETPYTFRNIADVDGDGIGEIVVYRLRVEMTETGEGRLALGGVGIGWRRQVSPAPDIATFPDVPINHPFFQFVEALAASGITAGYGNGNYGVNDPITRGQMAVFLSKALGLHWFY